MDQAGKAGQAERFEFSDGWLLMSVLKCSKNGAELPAIIGVGDMLNHAIFNVDELRTGFTRLLSAGMLEEEDELYRATTVARDMYREIQRRRLDMFEEVEAVVQMLNAMPPIQSIRTVEYVLTDAEYDRAVRANHDSLKGCQALGCMCLPAATLITVAVAVWALL